ncbi:probable valine--tRNA ligase, cytoplasmic [Tetranychus urticae]|uniref:valine--tRNA ligase n=1 Tax=Tetranychus urticae TaxID=32264 RepID=T1K2V8_TETUR|nr:probable valine--tRNA ligase, cytoplasmic [Tetranychus urticae]
MAFVVRNLRSLIINSSQIRYFAHSDSTNGVQSSSGPSTGSSTSKTRDKLPSGLSEIPEKPKLPRSPFAIYFEHRFIEIQKENNDLKENDAKKVIEEEWNDLKLKQPYEELSAKEHLEYKCATEKNVFKESLDAPISQTPKQDEYEKLWSHFWLSNSTFKTRLKNETSKSYSLLLPPPNITGQLHLGHALTLALQDAYIRHQRMFSDANITFIPGFDHAGISTYILLEKTTRKSLGKSVKDLRKAEFEEIFSKWKHVRIEEIKEQLNRLGGSLDYDKEYFTLDPALSNSVSHAFTILHEKGLIYRSNSPVNWSYFMQSALSDLEVNFRHVDGGTRISIPGYPEKVDFGCFHTVNYPVVDGEVGEAIKVSTMNIYTIPGDVAVVVNPKDSRYTKYHNRKVLNPITEKEIPVIVDKHAHIDFGTGAVKITPSSSYTDYEIALKHNLPICNFMNPDGTLVKGSISSRFENLYSCSHRYDLAKEILKVLQDNNLYHGYEKRATIVPFCKRSEDVIEHRIMPQWFLNVKPGYEVLKDCIENGTFSIYPPRKVNMLIEWFNKKRDWCLSRQIPFGHRIPAWKVYSQNEDTWFIAPNEKLAIEKACQTLGTNDVVLEQDADVLDTWFSSALLPLSALGWPNTNSSFFKSFHPLTLMETGFDILNFWVMKMALISLYLTEQLPFSKVYLHGMVCDGKGRKMSKSKGNIINPNDVIDGTSLDALQIESGKLLDQGLINQEEYQNALLTQRSLFPRGIAACGADGLRLSLYQYNATSEKISFGVNYLENNRHMVNKIWQAFRFYLLNFKEDSSSNSVIQDERELLSYKDRMSKTDKWIIGQFFILIKDFHSNIENFSYNGIYYNFVNFWVKSFCDIYIEVIKPRDHYQFDPVSYAICGQLIKSTLIAMHPLIPFVTEELYQRLKRLHSPEEKNKEIISILEERFPNVDIFSQFFDPKINHEMEIFREVGRILGNFKATCSLSKAEINNLPIKICSNEWTDHDLLEALKRYRNVHNITLLDLHDQNLIQSSINMRASHDTIVLIPYKEQFATKILQFFDKTISRSSKLLEKESDETKRANIASDLELIRLDREHLLNLVNQSC